MGLEGERRAHEGKLERHLSKQGRRVADRIFSKKQTKKMTAGVAERSQGIQLTQYIHSVLLR